MRYLISELRKRERMVLDAGAAYVAPPRMRRPNDGLPTIETCPDFADAMASLSGLATHPLSLENERTLRAIRTMTDRLALIVATELHGS